MPKDFWKLDIWELDILLEIGYWILEISGLPIFHFPVLTPKGFRGIPFLIDDNDLPFQESNKKQIKKFDKRVL